jgi:transposase InsO family protein
VLFDRVCRENGIQHLLTAPRSPTTTGKGERFHKTLKKEFLAGKTFVVGGGSDGDRWLGGRIQHIPTRARHARVMPRAATMRRLTDASSRKSMLSASSDTDRIRLRPYSAFRIAHRRELSIPNRLTGPRTGIAPRHGGAPGETTGCRLE